MFKNIILNLFSASRMPIRTRKFYPSSKTDSKHSIDEHSNEVRGDQYYADLSSNDDIDSFENCDDNMNNNNEALKV